MGGNAPAVNVPQAQPNIDAAQGGAPAQANIGANALAVNAPAQAPANNIPVPPPLNINNANADNTDILQPGQPGFVAQQIKFFNNQNNQNNN